MSCCSSCFLSTLISDVFISASCLLSPLSPSVSSVSPATASSSASLVSPNRNMSSSIVPRVISFTTSTFRFCPIRYARSCACRSLCGLKSWSNLARSLFREVTAKYRSHSHDHNAGCRQINAHAPRFGREKKDRYRFVLRKLVDERLPNIYSGRAGQQQISDIPLIEDGLEDVENLGKLCDTSDQMHALQEIDLPGRKSRLFASVGHSPRGVVAAQ